MDQSKTASSNFTERVLSNGTAAALGAGGSLGLLYLLLRAESQHRQRLESKKKDNLLSGFITPASVVEDEKMRKARSLAENAKWYSPLDIQKLDIQKDPINSLPPAPPDSVIGQLGLPKTASDTNSDSQEKQALLGLDNVLTAPVDLAGKLFTPSDPALNENQVTALLLGIPAAAIGAYALKKTIDKTYTPESNAERYARYMKQYNDLLARDIKSKKLAKTAGYINALEDRVQLNSELLADIGVGAGVGSSKTASWNISNILMPGLFTAGTIGAFKMTLDHLRDNNKQELKNKAAKMVMNRYRLMNPPRVEVVPVRSNSDAVKVDALDNTEQNTIPFVVSDSVSNSESGSEERKKVKNIAELPPEQFFSQLQKTSAAQELEKLAEKHGTTLQEFGRFWAAIPSDVRQFIVMTKSAAPAAYSWDQLYNLFGHSEIAKKLVPAMLSNPQFVKSLPLLTGNQYNADTLSRLPLQEQSAVIQGILKNPTVQKWAPELAEGINAGIQQQLADPKNNTFGLGEDVVHQVATGEEPKLNTNVDFLQEIQNPVSLLTAAGLGLGGVAMGKPGLGMGAAVLAALAPYIFKMVKPYIASFMAKVTNKTPAKPQDNAAQPAANPAQPQQAKPQQTPQANTPQQPPANPADEQPQSTPEQQPGTPVNAPVSTGMGATADRVANRTPVQQANAAKQTAANQDTTPAANPQPAMPQPTSVNQPQKTGPNPTAGEQTVLKPPVPLGMPPNSPLNDNALALGNNLLNNPLNKFSAIKAAMFNLAPNDKEYPLSEPSKFQELKPLLPFKGLDRGPFQSPLNPTTNPPNPSSAMASAAGQTNTPAAKPTAKSLGAQTKTADKPTGSA